MNLSRFNLRRMVKKHHPNCLHCSKYLGTEELSYAWEDVGEEEISEITFNITCHYCNQEGQVRVYFPELEIINVIGKFGFGEKISIEELDPDVVLAEAEEILQNTR
ncbi:MAG TPA: hypothetical protein VLE47_03415 [Candidatus Saccharimonadales bacterium]|nr:hypothetical protein [Candidatus Saccharimonadales bacterium]